MCGRHAVALAVNHPAAFVRRWRAAVGNHSGAQGSKRNGGGNGGLHRAFVHDIGAYIDRTIAEFCRQRRAAFVMDISDHHLCAQRCQPPHGRAAKATCAAGYDCRSVRDIHFCCSLIRVIRVGIKPSAGAALWGHAGGGNPSPRRDEKSPAVAMQRPGQFVAELKPASY